MTTPTIYQIQALETKQVWATFTRAYDAYRKSPFTAKGEKNWKLFVAAKQELKQRNQGWWGN